MAGGPADLIPGGNGFFEPSPGPPALDDTILKTGTSVVNHKKMANKKANDIMRNIFRKARRPLYKANM